MSVGKQLASFGAKGRWNDGLPKGGLEDSREMRFCFIDQGANGASRTLLHLGDVMCWPSSQRLKVCTVQSSNARLAGLQEGHNLTSTAMSCRTDKFDSDGLESCALHMGKVQF